MKATANVMSAKGHYGQVEVVGSNFQEITDKISKALIAMPDKVEDVNFYDWTKIVIEVENT